MYAVRDKVKMGYLQPKKTLAVSLLHACSLIATCLQSHFPVRHVSLANETVTEKRQVICIKTPWRFTQNTKAFFKNAFTFLKNVFTFLENVLIFFCSFVFMNIMF